MKQLLFVCLILGFVASTLSVEVINAEDPEYFDLIVDKEIKKVDEEAVLVGQILRECAKGLEARVTEDAHLGNETVEYFFKKLWRGVKNVAKKAGQVVGKVAHGIGQTRATDVIKHIIQRRFGGYALAEDESLDGLLLAFSKDMDEVGKALIEKGTKLCEECKRRPLEDAEKSFVKEFVAAF